MIIIAGAAVTNYKNMCNKQGFDQTNTPINMASFPSLPFALEEARRKFDHEESRRQTLDSKIGFVIAVDGLVIATISLLGLEELSPLLSGTILLVIGSVICGLIGVFPRKYVRPGHKPPSRIWLRNPPTPDVSYLYKYIRKEEVVSREQFLLDYSGAIETNWIHNARRNRWFRVSFGLASISLILVSISLL